MLENVSSLSLSSRYITTLPIRERTSSSDALRSLRPNSIHSPKGRISGFSMGHLVPDRDVGARLDSLSFREPATAFFFYLGPLPACVLSAFSVNVCQKPKSKMV